MHNERNIIEIINRKILLKDVGGTRTEKKH